MAWGSDVVAEVLGRLDLPYISLVPGASYRGLHDSLVNYLGNTKPSMILCLHEEHAVAIAQGYAKVTGKPMAVALHANVGLMHATMALFDAYCDRAPMVVLGATGPVDAMERRPWIDWIHTSADQGAMVRNFTKWDDQPGSVGAAVEALVRADSMTRSRPFAPTYVCLDAVMQESPLDEVPPLPDLDRFRPYEPPAPSDETVAKIVEALREAKRPLLMVGRVGRGQQEWDERVRLAEALGAAVVTDLKVPASFPTGHRLHPAVPGSRLTASGQELLRAADVVLSLNWVDLGGTLAAAFGGGSVAPRIISCSDEAALHNGWNKDAFTLPPVDLGLCAHPDTLVRALLARGVEGSMAERPGWPIPLEIHNPTPEPPNGEIPVSDLAGHIVEALGGREVCYAVAALGWSGHHLQFDGPLDYLGKDGGGGVGSGPGIAVGAALALDGSGRMPVAIVGDGDFLMGSSALWTAAHHRIPLLMVVANNRSYYNDEAHQGRVANHRGRPAENRSAGLHLRDPDPDLANLARSYGLHGYGPVVDADDLKAVLADAVSDVERGEAAVIDVHVSPRGAQSAPGASARGVRN